MGARLGIANEDCTLLAEGYTWGMTALEQVRQMSLHEKLLVMEAIWDEISREEATLEVPQWHKDLLDEREGQVAGGQAQFIDWEEAKKQIKEATE
jgi:hypothetical protein